MRQGELRTEVESKRTYGSRKAGLASERQALDIRAILRHESEYSDHVRSLECSDIEQERSVGSRVRAVDWQHLLDQFQYRQRIPHRSKPTGNSQSNGPIRHMARTR